MEKELNKLLNIDKKIVLAYCKVALYNLLNSPNEINIRSMEMEFEMLQEHFTTDAIIKMSNELKNDNV